jgi:hypothetical protein
MASIKISDLQSTTTTTSDWIELPSDEADSIYGGWRHRHRGQIAAHNLFSTVSSQIESISSIATQGGSSFQITIPNFSSNSVVTTTINGTQSETSGNLFYTDSGIAPIGGVPIPGQPGAYTF